MSCKILINATESEECRIAKVKDNKLEEFHFEATNREITQGNIYKGIITRVELSLQAVFVDYGTERHGFLQKQEIHSDYFQDSDERNRNLAKKVKRGQEVLVQVTKDPINKKGAMLTTFISLPGRHAVLMPGSTNKGVSRKITSEDERTRLKKILESLKLNEGFGAIIRTVGENATKPQISKDLQYQMRLWKDINKRVTVAPAPSLLYKEKNIVVRSIRDYFTPEVEEILVDDPSVYNEIIDFLKIISPKQVNLVKLYNGSKPIFSKHQLESQITSIFDNKVNLKSGGSIVIDPTEALVAIDVNSGKATKTKSISLTALQTNLEAAEEIARQLRLRDLGGLIVIDYIDMKDPKHRTLVEQTFKTGLKGDKARTKTGRISKFGLMEMSRQRIRPSITFGSFTKCIYCNGRGLVLSTEALALSFLRKLSIDLLKMNAKNARCIVPENVASYLLNKKRHELLEMEEKHDVTITIDSDPSMMPGENKTFNVDQK